MISYLLSLHIESLLKGGLQTESKFYPFKVDSLDRVASLESVRREVKSILRVASLESEKGGKINFERVASLESVRKEVKSILTLASLESVRMKFKSILPELPPLKV